MSEYSFILDGIKWSYSSLNTYETCPALFKQVYIDGARRSQNAYSEWGSLMHKLLEGYYTGKIEPFELLDQYHLMYDKSVRHKFPNNCYADLNQTYREAGDVYFRSFEDPFSSYDILGVEERFEIKIHGRSFTGVIDLILRERDSEHYVICDHKSHKFKGQREVSEYLRQLYLYTAHTYHKYGTYPTQLIFNPLRDICGVIRSDFDIGEYENTLRWFDTTIESIYNDKDFVCNPSAFYCNNLCSVNTLCKESCRC